MCSYRTDDVLDLIEELMAPFRALSASRLIEQDEDDDDDDNSDNEVAAIDNPTTTTPAVGTAAAIESIGHTSNPPPATTTTTSALPNILDGDESRIFEKSFESEWNKLMKEFRVRVKTIEKTLEMSMQEGFNKLRSAEGTVYMYLVHDNVIC